MRCPPGVICIEYMTSLFIIFIITLIVIYYNYNYHHKQPIIVEKKEIIRNVTPSYNMRYFSPPGNVYSDPHVPPLQANVYFPPAAYGIPINTRTRGRPSQYRQMGLLTRINGKETILPLMGRILDGARDQWQYYTMSDKFNSVKLPVSRNGRSCMNEYGCDNLSNGDTIYVEGYNDAFKVTLYDDHLPRYIPYV